MEPTPSSVPPDARSLAAILRDALARDGEVSILVEGRSMAPLFTTGDKVVLTPAAAKALEPGAIVTAVHPTSPDRLLTHRVYCVAPMAGASQLLLRGDRALGFDPPVPAAGVIGRVSSLARGERTLALDSSRGQRLNGWLQWLAAVEMRMVIGRSPGRPGCSPSETQAMAALAEARRRRLDVRLLHRALALVATAGSKVLGW